ncbi:MAG: hypothetical protein ACLQU2_23580 [Candidatus Binataceae bacterium]
MDILRNSTPKHDYKDRGSQPAMTARMAEQVRAWSGPPLLGLGCIIGYRAVAGGAVVSGLLLGTSVAGLGAVRTYYLLHHLRSKGSR